MSFRSVNEIYNFDYQDAVIESVKDAEDGLVFELTGLIVEPENSQNENYTKSYADTCKVKFKNCKILKAIKDGYKRYDANDKLLEEVPDEDIALESIKTILKNSKGAYLYAIEMCDNSTEELFVYNICFEFANTNYDTNVTKSYQVKLSFTECSITWNKYLNKVQY